MELIWLSDWHTTLTHFEAGKNGRHLPDDSFKCIFLNENTLISI